MMVKNKIKIGIDIDDTVVEFMGVFLEFCNNKFQTSFKFEEVISTRLEKVFNKEKNEFLDIFRELGAKDFFSKLDIIEDVKESLEKISEFFEIIFITARPKEIENQTLYLLKNSFPNLNFNVDHIVDCWEGLNKKSKFHSCIKHGIKFMIEDNKNHSLDCAKNGIKVFLLDKPWNQDCEHENIIRVKNWNEILEKLNREIILDGN